MNIGFLVFPDFNILDLSGPLAAFDVPRREIKPSPYSLTAYSEEGGPIVSSCGVSVNTAPLRRARLDTFIVVGGLGAVEASRRPAMMSLVKRTARHARRVASVCSGAFLLAEAGLLEGRRVTTHWEYANRFRQSYPNVTLELDQIYLRDGHVWSSGGVTAGIDLSLALIEEDVGLAMAQRTARVLVVYHRRVGGQSQFSALLEMEPASDRLRKALQFAREHLAEELSVERMALAVHISPRQFTRLFQRETGETPAKAVERLRAEVAHMQVANSVAPIETIARTVGFTNPERMRRAFMRLYGQPPQAVRRVAASHAAADTAEVE
ncbi:MAG TPA: GlxA family transcriptional regulator [Usitatibacter sp.]|jgi:transcriptional regulator GlxA family with amidase domain|nr:GlxA family transcriptional regulator [Usitatibacter sp.]